MKRYFFLFVLIMSVFTASAQDINTYNVEVGQFDKLKVCDNVTVVYRCLPDSSGFIQYRGDKQFADAFIITPKDGNLKIQVSTEDLGHPDLPVLYVYSDFLTSVENASNFTLMVDNPAPCAEFKAIQIGNGTLMVENVKANKVTASLATGNGTVNISGSCQDAVLKMVGTGMISADRLEAAKVQCRILGSGSIGCDPLETLAVRGLGSTKIYYKGDPKIKKSGGGKLYPLPEGRPLDTIVTADDVKETEGESAEGEEDEEEEGSSTEDRNISLL